MDGVDWLVALAPWLAFGSVAFLVGAGVGYFTAQQDHADSEGRDPA